MSRPLRLGSRGSALALAQSEGLARRLRPLWAAGSVVLLPVVTAGDRLQGQDAAENPEPGVFVRELDAALLSGRVDLCVHSAKDLPPDLPDGLSVAVWPPRADPRDALCGMGLRALPSGARVGTGSPRRAAQLRRLRPDVRILPLRGNVDTRLGRLRAGEFSALVLAAAGLDRLGRAAEIAERLPTAVLVPAPGQGALAVVVRSDDTALAAALRPLGDAETAFAVLAERAVQAALGGGCSVPAAACAEPLGDGTFRLTALVLGPTSGGLARAELRSRPLPGGTGGAELAAAAAEFGAAAAAALLREGAGALLAESPVEG